MGGGTAPRLGQRPWPATHHARKSLLRPDQLCKHHLPPRSPELISRLFESDWLSPLQLSRHGVATRQPARADGRRCAWLPRGDAVAAQACRAARCTGRSRGAGVQRPPGEAALSSLRKTPPTWFFHPARYRPSPPQTPRAHLYTTACCRPRRRSKLARKAADTSTCSSLTSSRWGSITVAFRRRNVRCCVSTCAALHSTRTEGKQLCTGGSEVRL